MMDHKQNFRFFILFVGVTIVFASCSYSTIPRYIKNEFKYSPSTNKESKLLSYNGLYKELHIKSDSAQKLCSKLYYTYSDSTTKDVGAFDMIFLKNGLCTMGYLNDFRISASKKEKENFKDGGSYWGYYETSHDTVKIKAIQRNSLMAASTDAFEQWYKIIDLGTLKPIYFRSITKGTCTERWGDKMLVDTAQYTHAKLYKMEEDLINLNTNWLINKEWFWKNTDEYQAWKKANPNK